MKSHLNYGSLLVPVVGLEPTRCRHQRILSPPRLPFQHTGIFNFLHRHGRNSEYWRDLEMLGGIFVQKSATSSG